MNFNQALQEQREAAHLSQEDAAKKLHISLRSYKDREDDRANLNIPERCGLLVGLGMNFEDAVKVATKIEMHAFGSGIDACTKNDGDPFVWETDDAFIISDRESDHNEYTIEKTRVRTSENILGWVDQLGEKTWVASKQLRLFVILASRYLNINIHPI